MILDKIIKNKQKEIEKRKKQLPLARLKTNLKKSDRNFKKAISNGFSLIAEIKNASPSEGIINQNFDFKETAKIYSKNKNVKAISVLTDYKFFFMAPTCLKEVRKLTKKPLLRKDFIIDEYQIYESRYLGADAILLIATLLTKHKIDKFIKIAKEYNMDCLVEVHNEKELRKLPDNTEIIGINNRNLDTLKVDLNTTLTLKSKIPKNKLIVTESGYHTNKEINKVKNKTNAVLIGTSILKEKDINKKINNLFKMEKLKLKIAPSILSADKNNLQKEVDGITPYADLIHIDVMDGKFVPIVTFQAKEIKKIKTKLEKDVHLMVVNPEKSFIPHFIDAGADIITIHTEACKDIPKTIQLIRSKGVKVGLSINPPTPLKKLLPYLNNIDMALIMSVNPGYAGQKFIPEVLSKVRELRKLKPDLDIQIDGGINKDTIKQAADAGANIFVAGSSIFKQKDRKKAIQELKNATK